jgi:zinc/manganese transport system permease protein
MLYEFFLQPFIDYGFMRRALVACLALSLSGAPLGVFLVLRRMTLVGDAMSHAILPGAALAFWIFGFSVLPMAAGGLMAGLLVAMLAGGLSRLTGQQEDASFTGLFTLSLAIGVMVISLQGNAVDVLHLLFGQVLAVDNQALWLIIGTTSISTLALSFAYRSLVAECADSGFLRMAGGHGAATHQLFLALLVLNLVAAFHVLGTLLAVGMMVLPAISARFWTRNMDASILLSTAISALSGISGLLLSYHASLPSGPAIVLCGGVVYLGSVGCGRYGSLCARYLPRPHLAH